jgi:hypothetical protein
MALVGVSIIECIQPKFIKQKMRGHKLRRVVQLHGALKKKGIKHGYMYLSTSLPYQNCMHAQIKEKIISRECRLPLTAESFVFPLSV